MLERYFVFPRIVDRIRNSWIGESIERHFEHLAEQGYAAGTMHYRVPLLSSLASSLGAEERKLWQTCRRMRRTLLPSGLEHADPPVGAAGLVRNSRKRFVVGSNSSCVWFFLASSVTSADRPRGSRSSIRHRASSAI
jgi:hypothetical protein